MPTIAVPPNPLTTHAVGAALLHQFTRDRFLEAGLNEELIQEAEESLDAQTTGLILSSEEPPTNGCTANTAAQRHSRRMTASFSSNNDSHNTSDGPLSSTQRLPNTSTDDQYLSLMNHSGSLNLSGDNVNNTTSETVVEAENDRTLYHSIDASRLIKTSLDRLETSSVMVGYGRELRLIAEEFARSRQRQTVREQANGVQLESINKQSFLELLDELFAGGITREKIAVLFFFCTDVALRAASMAQDLVVKLLCWSFSFIINTVCKKVDELGGWDHVLFNKVPSLLFSCVTVLGICAILTYLHRSLRS